MPSIEEKVGEPQPTDKEYVEIIKSDVEIDKKFIDETGLPTTIIYYCRDCKVMTNPKRIGKKLKFSCMICKGSNVSFGTESSIEKYYKTSKSDVPVPPKEREKGKEKDKGREKGKMNKPKAKKKNKS